MGNRVVRGDGPTAVQSKIGYLHSGPLPTSTTDTATDCIMNIITPPRDTYDLERFRKLETLGIQSEKDGESSEYRATYCTVFKDGRYSAQLPWKPYRVPDPPPLPKVRVQDAPDRRAAYRRRRSHTSSDVTDEQWSHHIKARSEALPIRSSTDVFFVAGRMSRRRRRPYLARTTTLHTRHQRRRYVMTQQETVDPTSNRNYLYIL